MSGNLEDDFYPDPDRQLDTGEAFDAITQSRATGRSSGFGLLQQRTLKDGDSETRSSRRLPPVRGAVPKIPGYRDFEYISAGGMGEVWKAVDTITERVDAIKILPLQRRSGERDRLRFQREIKTSAKLRHENIGMIYRGSMEEDLCYYAMEFVDGPTLRKYLETENPSLETRIQLVITLCRAIELAHTLEIVHRDLKPSNILMATVDGKVVPKIIDFGLAKSFSEKDVVEAVIAAPEPVPLPVPLPIDQLETFHFLSLKGDVGGTPSYMSPEQAKGKGSTVDGRSDLYSLGTLLYEMVTGALPYDISEGASVVVQRKRTSEMPTPPSIPKPDIHPELEAILSHAIHPHPAKRYQTVSAFAEDLQGHLENRPVQAYRISATGVGIKFLQRNRLRIGLIAGLLILCGASLYGLRASQSAQDQVAVEKKSLQANSEALAVKQATVERDSIRIQQESEILQKETEALERETEALSKAERLKHQQLQAAFSNRVHAISEHVANAELSVADAALKSLQADLASEQSLPDLERRTIAESFSPQLLSLEQSLQRSRLKQEAERQLMAAKVEDVLVRLQILESGIRFPVDQSQFQPVVKLHDELIKNELHADPAVEASLASIGSQIYRELEQTIQAANPLERNRQLSEARAVLALLILTDLLSPSQKESLDLQYQAQIKRHLLRIENRTSLELRVIGSVTSFTIAAAQSQEVPLVIDANESPSRSWRFEPTDSAYAVVHREFTCPAASGSVQLLSPSDFSFRRIPFVPPVLPVDISVSWRKFGEANWRSFEPEASFLPGDYEVRYRRADYHDHVSSLSVKLSDVSVQLSDPKSLPWLALPHLEQFQALRKSNPAGMSNQRLSSLQALQATPGASPAFLAQLREEIAALESSPEILLSKHLSPSEARARNARSAIFQIFDPYQTLRKSRRMDHEGFLNEPPSLPTLDPSQVQQLPAALRDRYELARIWNIRSSGDPTADRRAVLQRQREYVAQAAHSVSTDLLDELHTQAVLLEQGAVPMSDSELSGGKPCVGALASLCRAHQIYKKRDPIAASKVLQFASQSARQGGQFDAYDLTLCGVAFLNASANNISGLRAQGYAIGSENAYTEIENLQVCARQFQAVLLRSSDVSVQRALARLHTMAQREKLPELIRFTTFLVKSLPEMPDEKRQLGRLASKKADEEFPISSEEKFRRGVLNAAILEL